MLARFATAYETPCFLSFCETGYSVLISELLTADGVAAVSAFSPGFSTAAKKYVEVALSEPSSTASTIFGTQILAAWEPRFCFVAGLHTGYESFIDSAKLSCACTYPWLVCMI